jgi:hypothetical protein
LRQHNEIARSVSDGNIPQNQQSRLSEQRAFQNNVPMRTKTLENLPQQMEGLSVSERRLSYADVTSKSNEQLADPINNPSFKRTGSLHVRITKVPDPNQIPQRIPTRAYLLSQFIDFNAVNKPKDQNPYNIKKFMNYENKIKDLHKNAELYEMDIPAESANTSPEIDRVRDGKRVIVDKTTGKRWYTADHYKTFTDMHAPISTPSQH